MAGILPPGSKRSVCIVLFCSTIAAEGLSCVTASRRAESFKGNGIVPCRLQSETASEPCVSINTASAGDLERLPGVGSQIAQRIIEHRKRYGRFRRVEHLMMVRGISERRFNELRSFIKVD